MLGHQETALHCCAALRRCRWSRSGSGSRGGGSGQAHPEPLPLPPCPLPRLRSSCPLVVALGAGRQAHPTTPPPRVAALGAGKSKGFAFLAYEDQRSTVLAVDNLSGAQVAGRVIRVEHVDNYRRKRAEVGGTRPCCGAWWGWDAAGSPALGARAAAAHWEGGSGWVGCWRWPGLATILRWGVGL